MNWPLVKTVGKFFFHFVKETIRKARQGSHQPSIGPGTEMAKCARCYTYVPLSGALPGKIMGYTLHFCSNECFEAYRRDHHDIDAAAIGDK